MSRLLALGSFCQSYGDYGGSYMYARGAVAAVSGRNLEGEDAVSLQNFEKFSRGGREERRLRAR
jgi:hypothetical protein